MLNTNGVTIVRNLILNVTEKQDAYHRCVNGFAAIPRGSVCGARRVSILVSNYCAATALAEGTLIGAPGRSSSGGEFGYDQFVLAKLKRRVRHYTRLEKARVVNAERATDSVRLNVVVDQSTGNVLLKS